MYRVTVRVFTGKWSHITSYATKSNSQMSRSKIQTAELKSCRTQILKLQDGRISRRPSGPCCLHTPAIRSRRWSTYCFLPVRVFVCLYRQKLKKNYWTEIDVTWNEHVLWWDIEVNRFWWQLIFTSYWMCWLCDLLAVFLDGDNSGTTDQSLVLV